MTVSKTTVTSQAYLGEYSVAPNYQQANEDITTGYRINHNAADILKSLFTLHNETMNVWIHLLGAFIMLALAANHDSVQPLFQQLYPFANHQNITSFQPAPQCQACGNHFENAPITAVPTWPITIFLISAAICLSCSAGFHLFHPLSKKIFHISLSLDYAGIGVLMIASPLPAFYYTFYCWPNITVIYVSINTIIGIASFLACFVDWLHTREYIVHKLVFYSACGLLCIFTVLHILRNELIFQNFGDSFRFSSSVGYYISSLVSYLAGISVYGARCPQRRNPGKYDVCGQSHQIWHALVVLGILLTYGGALCNLEAREIGVCPA